MQIIPVINVQNSKAVAATGSDREDYRQLTTPFSDTADPVEIVRGFKQTYSNQFLYLADLDGIKRGTPNYALYHDVVENIKDTEVWANNGQDKLTDNLRPSLSARLSHVVGSESLKTVTAYQEIALSSEVPPILLLDYRDGEFLGPHELLVHSGLWPRDVIVMALSHIGRQSGPDFDRVKEVLTLAGDHRRVFAAGGVRHLDDLRSLCQMGVTGALVSSALHNGKIKRSDLEIAAGF